jgi:REP element-mobilizing transposase RayT
MPLWRLYYHIVWATKNRLPMITPKLEPQLYKYIIDKAIKLESVIHAIGGVDNHIHLIASIPPKISISNYIGQIKGVSAFYVNSNFSQLSIKFEWQNGFSVFSLGSKQLEIAVQYVENQKQHHQQGTIIDSLEQTLETD